MYPCRKCHALAQAKDTRRTEWSVRRRYVCKCGYRFTTHEAVAGADRSTPQPEDLNLLEKDS